MRAVGSGEGIRRFVGRAGAGRKTASTLAPAMPPCRMSKMASVGEGRERSWCPRLPARVALAYNLPDIGGELKLSRQGCARNISRAGIKNWNDPIIGARQPGSQGYPSSPSPRSSARTAAAQPSLPNISTPSAIPGSSRFGPATLINWPGNAMRARVAIESVASLIQQSIGSVGYVGYEFARRAGLHVALVENREGKFVAPGEQSGSAAIAQVELPDNLGSVPTAGLTRSSR